VNAREHLDSLGRHWEWTAAIVEENGPALGPVIHYEQGNERVTVEYDTAGRVYWAGRYVDDVRIDTVDALDYRKRFTVAAWLSRHIDGAVHA
jgi:hypothetical protein